MKKLTLSLAALAGMTATANADYVNIADLTNAPIVQISGATAPDKTFKSFLLLNEANGGIFQDGTVRRFTGEEAADGDDFTITCGLPTTASLSTISNLTNFKDAGGTTRTASTTTPICVQKVAQGSGDGTSSILAGSALTFADLEIITTAFDSNSDEDATTAAFTGVGTITTTVNAAAGTNGAYVHHDGFSSAVEDTAVLADCGVADVEPALFNDVTDPSVFSSVSVFDIPWGLPVSIPLYYALQFAQLSGDCLPSATNYDNADGDADGVAREPACVPSLRTSDIRGIFTGDIFYTEELLDDTGVAVEDLTAVTTFTAGKDVTGAVSATSTLQGSTAGANNAVTAIPTANAVHGDKYVYLCRRKSSSGTQASYEAKFLRQRCEEGGLQMKRGDLTGDGYTAGAGGDNTSSGADGKKANFLGSALNQRVYANSGSSDVSECVTNATVQNVWAIGINSTEKVPYTQSTVANGRAGYAHVKIDGVLPTSLNVTTGHHPYFSSLSGNVRSGEETAGGAPEFCVENIFNKAGNATVIAAVQSDFVHGFGQGGPMASGDKAGNTLSLGTYGSGLTESEYQATPVNNYSVSTSGSLNNCAYPTKIPSDKDTNTIIPTIVGEIK